MVEPQLAPSSPAILIPKDDVESFEKKRKNEKSRTVLKTALP